MKYFKRIAAFLLAGASAYALSFAADLMFGRVFGLFPDTVWLPIGTWTGIFILLLSIARQLSDSKWCVILPFGLFSALALVGALVGTHPHSYLVAAVMFIIVIAHLKKPANRR
jgi:hypothetical protein